MVKNCVSEKMKNKKGKKYILAALTSVVPGVKLSLLIVGAKMSSASRCPHRQDIAYTKKKTI